MPTAGMEHRVNNSKVKDALQNGECREPSRAPPHTRYSYLLAGGGHKGAVCEWNVYGSITVVTKHHPVFNVFILQQPGKVVHCCYPQFPDAEMKPRPKSMGVGHLHTF